MEHAGPKCSAGPHNSCYRCSCLVQVWFKGTAVTYLEARWPDVAEFKSYPRMSMKRLRSPSTITFTSRKQKLKDYLPCLYPRQIFTLARKLFWTVEMVKLEHMHQVWWRLIIDKICTFVTYFKLIPTLKWKFWEDIVRHLLNALYSWKKFPPWGGVWETWVPR